MHAAGRGRDGAIRGKGAAGGRGANGQRGSRAPLDAAGELFAAVVLAEQRVGHRPVGHRRRH